MKDQNIMKSAAIRSIASSIPDFSDDINFFFSCFDHVVAFRDGKLDMTPGGFPDLDSAKNIVSEWENRFSAYIKQQEIRLK